MFLFIAFLKTFLWFSLAMLFCGIQLFAFKFKYLTASFLSNDRAFCQLFNEFYDSFCVQMTSYNCGKASESLVIKVTFSLFLPLLNLFANLFAYVANQINV